MRPALSAPDLQCMSIGYSMRLNRSRAPKISCRLGAARERIWKSSK